MVSYRAIQVNLSKNRNVHGRLRLARVKNDQIFDMIVIDSNLWDRRLSFIEGRMGKSRRVVHPAVLLIPRYMKL